MTKTFYECCKTVQAKGFYMIRPCKNNSRKYHFRKPFDADSEWFYLDAVTANLVCQVHDALSPDRQEKFKSLPAGAILEFCREVIGGT